MCHGVAGPRGSFGGCGGGSVLWWCRYESMTEALAAQTHELTAALSGPEVKGREREFQTQVDLANATVRRQQSELERQQLEIARLSDTVRLLRKEKEKAGPARDVVLEGYVRGGGMCVGGMCGGVWGE